MVKNNINMSDISFEQQTTGVDIDDLEKAVFEAEAKRLIEDGLLNKLAKEIVTEKDIDNLLSSQKRSDSFNRNKNEIEALQVQVNDASATLLPQEDVHSILDSGLRDTVQKLDYAVNKLEEKRKDEAELKNANLLMKPLVLAKQTIRKGVNTSLTVFGKNAHEIGTVQELLDSARQQYNLRLETLRAQQKVLKMQMENAQEDSIKLAESAVKLDVFIKAIEEKIENYQETKINAVNELQKLMAQDQVEREQKRANGEEPTSSAKLKQELYKYEILVKETENDIVNLTKNKEKYGDKLSIIMQKLNHSENTLANSEHRLNDYAIVVKQFENDYHQRLVSLQDTILMEQSLQLAGEAVSFGDELSRAERSSYQRQRELEIKNIELQEKARQSRIETEKERQKHLKDMQVLRQSQVSKQEKQRAEEFEQARISLLNSKTVQKIQQERLEQTVLVGQNVQD